MENKAVSCRGSTARLSSPKSALDKLGPKSAVHTGRECAGAQGVFRDMMAGERMENKAASCRRSPKRLPPRRETGVPAGEGTVRKRRGGAPAAGWARAGAQGFSWGEGLL